MFADFTKKSFAQSQKLKNKDVKQIHAQLAQRYPRHADLVEKLNTAGVTQLKTANRVTFIAIDGILTFFSFYNSPFHPMLRVLHAYPSMGKYMTVDGGAVHAMLNGAQLMAPGVVGIEEGVDIGDLVVLRAQDAEAFAVGKMAQTRADIMKESRSGIAVETIMIIGDGLWEAGDKI